MGNCFIELGCEELPSSAIQGLMSHFEARCRQLGHEFKVPIGHHRVVLTPRRIIIELSDVASWQQVWHQTINGPKLQQATLPDGSLSPAAKGFLAKYGTTFEQAEDRAQGRLVHTIEHGGAQTQDLLQSMITYIFSQLSGIKGMRWGDLSYVFPRPVHWLCVLWQGTCVPVTFMGLKASPYSYGHRFLSPSAFKVQQDRWEDQYLEHYVMVDAYKRQESILAQAKDLLPSDIRMEDNKDLLNEVAYLVEYPVVFIGAFDEVFLTLPKEVLMLTMNIHQKCFALTDSSGQLVPKFLGVSNLKSQDEAQMISGNERVVRARLSDALFFYEQDKKHTLASRLAAFDRIIDHEQLGTVSARIERVTHIMAQLNQLGGLSFQPEHNEYAMCKADLLTETVGELPEVEQTMGYYFALEEGLSESLATTIRDHAKPVSHDDSLPATRRAAWVSLAERLERIVAFYSIDLPPKADKDPYGIKRYAAGLVRLCVEGEWSFDWSLALEQAFSIMPSHKDIERKKAAILALFKERFKTYAIAQGFNHDVIQSVLALDSSNVLDQWLRIKAIAQWLETPQATAFLATFKRLSSLIKHDAIGGVGSSETKQDEDMYQYCQDLVQKAQKHTQKNSYTEALEVMASSSSIWTDYLENVHIMADNPEVAKYRCSMVRLVVKQCHLVADLSYLQWDKAKA